MIKTTIFIIVLFIKFFRNRFAAIPGIIYAIVYTVFAILLSEENGGWTDFYKINAGYVPIILEVLAAIIIFLGIPTLLRLGHNKVHKRFKQKIKNYYLDPQNFPFNSIEDEIQALAENAVRFEEGRGDYIIPKKRISLIKEKYNSDLSITELCNYYTIKYLEMKETNNGRSST